MAKSIISEGKTTTEAIEKGLKLIGLPKELVEIKVIEENKKSFFDILAPKVVKVEIKEKEAKKPEEFEIETTEQELEEIQTMANSDILEDEMQIYLMNPFSNNYICCFGVDKAQIGSWNNTRLLYDQIKLVKGKTYAEWEAQMREGKNGEVVFFEMDGVVYGRLCLLNFLEGLL